MKKIKRIEVYSAIIGDIDNPRKDDILCFKEFGKFKRDVFNAKIFKILPHLFVDANITIWIDGNIALNEEPQKIVKLLGKADIAAFKHFGRDCIYEEALASAGKYPDEKIQNEIYNHAEYYQKLGYPEHNGLWECNMLIRRNNKRMRDFNNAWWAEICRHSNRDQLSFPYILNKFPKVKIKTLESDVRNHPYFIYKSH